MQHPGRIKAAGVLVRALCERKGAILPGRLPEQRQARSSRFDRLHIELLAHQIDELFDFEGLL
jgi:hypothetical protein